ncbi:unnamed protein product [Cylindrotheca closterium]|uniref:DUF1995 domain-containing protein n=1 Tax=Cylindrotheca closterium TaxID=2856 RepID=A0AAD2JGE9_9STRA|nr:unnamed protein product [Cylindrotheca closterium]
MPIISSRSIIPTILLLTMVASSTHAFVGTTTSSAPTTTTTRMNKNHAPFPSSRIVALSSLSTTSRSSSVETEDTAGNDNNDNDSDSGGAAKQLLDKAAQLRAEIAAMEGKTVEQVTQEAKQKKQDQQDRLKQQEEENAVRIKERQASSSSASSKSDQGRSFVPLPNTVDDMIRQASRAVERAYQDGKTRQTVRFHLVPFEEDDPNERLQDVSNNYNVLEENQWPGGAQQMYREAGKPMTSALLRELRILPKKAAMDDKEDDAPASPQWSAPKIVQQDIWDFDGSALHTAESSAGPSGDIQALVFANTDVKYIRDIDEISKNIGPDRLFLLVNPFWRNLDSWSFNLLAPKAKDKAQQVIFTDDDNGNYSETYVNMIFQVRGEKCIAIKAYPYDWQIFAMREDDYYPNSEYSIRLGSCKDEPTSSLVTKLLNERPEFKETKTMRQFRKL